MSTLITAGLSLINELKDGHEAHKERLLARYDEAIKLPRKKKKAVRKYCIDHLWFLHLVEQADSMSFLKP